MVKTSHLYCRYLCLSLQWCLQFSLHVDEEHDEGRLSESHHLHHRWRSIWSRSTLHCRYMCKQIKLFLNSLPPRRCAVILKMESLNTCYRWSTWAPLVKLLWGECYKILWWYVNIGSGNFLVSSCNKPLPEAMLTDIYVTPWHHWAAMS